MNNIENKQSRFNWEGLSYKQIRQTASGFGGPLAIFRGTVLYPKWYKQNTHIRLITLGLTPLQWFLSLGPKIYIYMCVFPITAISKLG